MPKLMEMFDDPDPLDDDDPEVRQESFETFKVLGWSPGDLKSATTKERTDYANWLIDNKDD